jgi:hypothetical protein
MQEILGKAVGTQKCICLYVENYNPAKRFYERMHWVPEALTPVLVRA